MKSVSAYFNDLPGSALDKACRHIFEANGGKFVGAGTVLIGAAAGERDVQYDVDDTKVDTVRAALKKAGFRLEPTRESA